MAENPVSTRGWCLTINNYSEEQYELVKQFKADYLIVGREVGESGTPHLQAYLYKQSKITFSALKKLFPTAHIEPAKGTALENQTYCSKENNYYETGTLPKQGKRSDLTALAVQITTNAISLENLILADPMAYHQYGRTLEKLADIKKLKQYRTETTTCEWIYGPTGTGKSHRAFSGYTPETHYNHNDDGLWWDNYRQQDIVIINEFRGEIKFKKLLELIDKYPVAVPQRNKAPMPFISKHIIITSSKSPEELYSYCGDNIDQLLRRIKIVNLTEKYLGERT